MNIHGVEVHAAHPITIHQDRKSSVKRTYDVDDVFWVSLFAPATRSRGLEVV